VVRRSREYRLQNSIASQIDRSILYTQHNLRPARTLRPTHYSRPVRVLLNFMQLVQVIAYAGLSGVREVR